jgi:hemolysin III
LYFEEYHELFWIEFMKDNIVLKNELANSITHGLGVLFSMVGIALLMPLAVQKGAGVYLFSCAIYGASLLLLYSSSTTYHSIQHPEVKHILRLLDHISIYILIAGTYTPFLLLCIKGTMGWVAFALIWLIALGGGIYKIMSKDKNSKVSLALYIGMGWMIILLIKPFWETVPLPSIILVAIGGLSYTLGTYFYTKPHKLYYHAIWHVFVLVGSITHFLAVVNLF